MSKGAITVTLENAAQAEQVADAAERGIDETYVDHGSVREGIERLRQAAKENAQ